MTYNATYDATDTSAIVIDGVSTVLVAAVGFAALIGLTILYVWFRKRLKK